MKKPWLRALAAFAVLILAVLLGIIAYVDFNQKPLLKQLVTELNKRVKGNLSIEKVSVTIFSEFPNLSMTLHNGVLKDSASQKEIFRAGQIYCRINPFKLLFKQIDVRSVVVQNANIYLQQDSSGLNAANIFRKSNDTTSSGSLNISFNLKQLKIVNLQLSFNDEVRNKHISVKAKDLRGSVAEGDSAFSVQLQGFIHSDSMMFKADKGSFLYDRDAELNAHLSYNKYLHRLSIDPSTAIVDEQQYALEGYFLLGQKPAFLRLLISDSAVNFNKGRMVLSTKILQRLKNIDVSDPVNVRVLIQGPMAPDMPPEVDADFILTNSHIQYYGAKLSEVNMHGLFMNHVKPGVKNDDSNSELIFDFTQAKVNGVPLTAKVSVVDLKALHAELTTAVNTPLTALNQAIGNDSVNYHFNSGYAAVNVHYKGTIYYYMDTIKSNFDDTLTGSVKISNGVFDYATRSIELSNIQTDIDFNLNQVDLKQISCAINGNQVNMSGSVTSLRRVVSGDVEKMVGNLKVDAPRFDLNKVLVMKKLAKAPSTAAATNPAQTSKITALVNTITNMLSVNLAVKCNEFIFRKLTARQVNAEINASSTGLDIKSFNLNMCKGEVALNGSLNTAQNNDHVNGTVQLKNIDVKEFLSAMQNFDQHILTDDNITGRLNAQVNFASPLKADYNIIPDSMQGMLHFSLQNGSLDNFAPLANVGKKIFRNRDFNHVAFADIKDTIALHDNTFYFHKMEISSSVMRLFMQGRFSFAGACDLAIQVPLNNLKRQDINYEPENIGVDGKAGASIFLHVTGDKNSKVKISLDPTARQRMKKGVSAKPIQPKA